MAKQVKEQLEFVKFFKNLYSDEIPLNFDDYFIISNNNGRITVHFPENKYYKIFGILDISEIPTFYNWLKLKISSVKIRSDELDVLRKIKMSDFESVDYSDESKYVIKVTNSEIDEFVIERLDMVMLEPSFEFKYQYDIPNEAMDSTTIVFYINNGVISLEPSDNAEVLLDAAINKNFQIVFKEPSEEKLSKGAFKPKYTIHATEKVNGFRVIMLECVGKHCTMKQYFRVI